ncbi:SulA-like leucine-rich domain-containing protein [Orbaceae bacterium ESL0721]|nr:SulA-like leucine-rich domain-containing protein [Orbaceae bacterium ESL0721]
MLRQNKLLDNSLSIQYPLNSSTLNIIQFNNNQFNNQFNNKQFNNKQFKNKQIKKDTFNSRQMDLFATSQPSNNHFTSPFQQLLEQQQQLLQQFNKKNKWQLWIADRLMLKRTWLNSAGLDRQKVIHLANICENNLVTTVEKALLSQNCSYVVASINQLNPKEKMRLQQAVITSGTHLFLVSDEQINHESALFH